MGTVSARGIAASTREVSAAAMEPCRTQTGVDDARLTVQSRPDRFPVAGLARDGLRGRWSGNVMRLPAPPQTPRRVTPMNALLMP